jgi:hypothetical protein
MTKPKKISREHLIFHEKDILKRTKLAIKNARMLLDSTEMCVDNGGFPVYLNDLLTQVTGICQLAAQYAILKNVQHDASFFK